MSCDAIFIRQYFHTTEDTQKRYASHKKVRVSRPKTFYFIRCPIIYWTPNNYQGLCKALGDIQVREGPIFLIWMAILVGLLELKILHAICPSIISSKLLQKRPERHTQYFSASCLTSYKVFLLSAPNRTLLQCKTLTWLLFSPQSPMKSLMTA